MFSLPAQLQRAAHLRGQGLASVHQDRRYRWRDVAERSARLASALRTAGLRDGDRVALLMLNSDHYLEAFFAALWVGGIVVPLNTRWSAEEIRFALRDSGAAILMFGAEFAATVNRIEAASSAQIQPIFCSHEAARGFGKDSRSLISSSEPVAASARCGSALAGIFYTGGTTGSPKGVMLSHDNLVSSALVTAPHIGIGPDTVFLHAAPTFHIAGTNCLLATTVQGGTNAFAASFEPSSFADLVTATGATQTLLVPTMIAMLLDHHDAAAMPPPALEQITYGAASMSQALMDRLLETWPSIRLAQGYGQTEMAPAISILSPEYHVRTGSKAGKLRSAGRPVPSVDVKIVDAQGNELGATATGEIWARGPNAMLGYWNQPELSAQTIVDGWVRTGDAGYMDEDGFLYVVDRIKDMIISGGENVYSVEVENALSTHPAVAQCAVIGVPDALWGERVHAVIMPREGASLSLDEAVEHCRQSIAAFKCPKSLEIRNDPLPLLGPGKVAKRRLRDELLAGPASTSGSL